MNAAKLSVQRKRAQNFSEKEKLILTEIVFKYKNIIENKRTDGVTSKDKEKCWKVIENNYNSTSSSTEFRSAEVLKSCWENLKKKTRKFFADERIQLYKTGGGPCESQTDVVLERVRDIIKPSVEGIKSDYDCDAIEDVYTDQSTNACKIPTKTNSCETSSDSIEMDEWLPVDDNDNDQDDVLLYLQENAGAMRQNSFDNVSDGHEMTNYDKENDIIGNDSVSDVNGNSSVFMRENNTQHCLKKSNIQNIKKPEKQDVQNTSAVQILKRKISTPLQVKTNDLNDQYKSKKLNRQDNKPYKKKEETITSRMSQFDMLTDSKIKLTECMTDDFKAKREIEMQILSTRLKKEQLEVQILEKELLLQEHRLQREVQQNKSFNVS